MASASSLNGLMKFLNREEWREAFEETLHAHFFVACKNAGIDMGQIADILGDQTASTLWGCAFEDFLARILPDGRNMVDDYLRRRAYKESASAKAYMRAIRSSVMSLYEVSDIVPGQSLLARDLIRGGEPLRVVERTATKQMKVWDRIAARIVPLAGTYQMCGGVLVYSLEMFEQLTAKLGWFKQQREREMHSVADELGVSLDEARLADLMASGDLLGFAAPIFTRIWLSDTLNLALNPRLPKLVNTDRDAIVFCTLTFPLANGASVGSVCSMLATIDDLRRDDDAFFNWIGPVDAPSTPPPRPSITRDTTHSEGGRVLGSVEVTEGAVVVTTNSRERAERARAKFSELLGASVGEPALTAETPEDAMAKGKATPKGDEAAPKPVLPPDQERRLVHSCLDDHYRRTLDQGLPMLDGMTPRQAARSAAGRAKVVTWLKYLENQSQKQPDPNDPLATYDVGWLWTELGLIGLRV
jgi:hypothetical protein